MIERVDARTVRVPLDAPTGFSGRTVTERHYTIVRVVADGVTGYGFCYSGHAAGELVTSAALDLLAPVLLNEDPHRTEGLWEDMYQEGLLHGRAGAVMRAQSALDIALWDRNARAVGLPLWRYLGGAVRKTVPAYASGGYYLPGKTVEDLAAEVRGYVQRGFKAVKIKVGRVDAGTDAERIAAARDAVGPDVLLMLDANNAWRDLPTALRALRRWEASDPYWIEEPFPPDDIRNHALLARETPILVATGEIEQGRWRHQQLLEERAAGILQTDAAVCGGITEFRRIAAMSAGYGVPLAPHWFHDLHVQLVAATPNARIVEYFGDGKVLNFWELVEPQVEVTSEGELRVPTGPGLGFDLPDERLDRYDAHGWRNRT